MFSFGSRIRVLRDAIEDGGGGGKRSVKSAMQNVVDQVKSKLPVPSGYMAAGRAAQSGADGGTAVGPTSEAGQEVLDDKVSPTKPRRVSYIGNSGAKKTGTVTPGSTPGYYKTMQDYIDRIYADQVKANNDALAASEQRARENTAAQIDALGEQYAGTNRQLYRDYMNSRRTLPQRMAAQGYGGGLSESSLLRLDNSYGEGLNENERARLAQETSYNQALAQQLFEAQQKTNEANSQASQQRYRDQAALKEAIYKDAQQRAATMAASGDFSEYKRLGYSDSEIKYLKDMWRRMNPRLA